MPLSSGMPSLISIFCSLIVMQFTGKFLMKNGNLLLNHLILFPYGLWDGRSFEDVLCVTFFTMLVAIQNLLKEEKNGGK